MSDRQRVLDRIDEMAGIYAVMGTGLLLLSAPDIRQRLRDMDYQQVGLPRGDGSQVTIKLDSAFAAAEADPAGFNLMYLRTVAGMIVTTVADDVKGLGFTLADKDPDEFHVLRHLRNAAAHGNRFDIRNAHTPPVSFSGLTISHALDGEADVFFEHASPALLMDLLQAIRLHL